MKQILQPDIRYQAFRLMAMICANKGIPIGSDEALKIAQDEMLKSMENVTNRPTFLYGHRAQAIFLGVVASLGKVRLIKEEDGTACFANDSEEVAIPDYRVVLHDGAQCMIEVKNFHQDNLTERFIVDSDLMAAWQRYSQLAGAEFKIAIYFSRFQHWTLLSPRAFQFADGKHSINFQQAIMKNEMALLGDVTIGTRCPLRLKLRMEKIASQAIGDSEEEIEGRIVEAGLYCQDQHIKEPTEQSIAFTLIMFGKWNLTQRAELEKPAFINMIFESKPEVETPTQGFEICDSLSSMFTRRYLSASTDKDGKLLTQIYAQWKPSEFGKLIPENYKGVDLPLWQLHLQPNYS
jgi:hypothetical protein